MAVENVIAKLDEVWLEASSVWTDETTVKFNSVVIERLQQSLGDLRCCCDELARVSEEALAQLSAIEQTPGSDF